MQDWRPDQFFRPLFLSTNQPDLQTFGFLEGNLWSGSLMFFWYHLRSSDTFGETWGLELSDCRSLTSQRTSPMKQTLQLSRHGSRVCLSQCGYHLRVCRINPQAEFLGSGDEEDFDAEVPFTVFVCWAALQLALCWKVESLSSGSEAEEEKKVGCLTFMVVVWCAMRFFDLLICFLCFLYLAGGRWPCWWAFQIADKRRKGVAVLRVRKNFGV